MATENVKLKVDIDTGTAAKSLTDLKKEFKALQTELSNTKVGTKEYSDTLKKLGETKDDIGDLRDQITALGSSASKFQAVGKVVQGISGGFAAASSAAALFGGEAEEVQKAMLKVQAALALQQGISAVLELGDAFKALKLIIASNPIFILATVLASIIGYFVGLENIINGVKAGFSALGDAVSSAFSAIIDGVLYAIDLYTQYLDILTFGLFDINAAYKGYIKNIEDANEAERQRIADINEQIKKNEELIDAQRKLVDAYEKAADAVDERRTLVTEAYDQEIALANAAGENTIGLEADKLEAIRVSLIESIRLRTLAFNEEQKLLAASAKNVELADAKNNLFEKKFAEIILDVEKTKAEGQKKTLKDLEKQLETTNNSIAVKEVEAEKERQDAGKAAYEQRLKDQEDYLKRKQSLEELYAEEDRKFREKSGKEYLEYLKSLKEEEIVINFDALNENVAINEQKSIDDINASAEDFKNFKIVQDAKVQMLSDTLTTLSGLTDLFGKKNEANAKRAFQINKTLSAGDALIKTYQGANAIFASAAANPASVLFPAQPFISAGLAIVAGLGNVAKIASTQFGSTSGSGGGGSSVGSAPSVSTPSSTGNNSIGTTLLNRQAIEQGQQPTENRVYVVESDMTNSQRRVQGIRNRATVVE